MSGRSFAHLCPYGLRCTERAAKLSVHPACSDSRHAPSDHWFELAVRIHLPRRRSGGNLHHRKSAGRDRRKARGQRRPTLRQYRCRRTHRAQTFGRSQRRYGERHGDFEGRQWCLRGGARGRYSQAHDLAEGRAQPESGNVTAAIPAHRRRAWRTGTGSSPGRQRRRFTAGGYLEPSGSDRQRQCLVRIRRTHGVPCRRHLCVREGRHRGGGQRLVLRRRKRLWERQ
jgi:hypothetical protein